MNLDEEGVRQALRNLDKDGLAGPADSFDGRVTKYEHRLQEAYNFDRRETAILCVLAAARAANARRAAVALRAHAFV